MIYIYIYSPGHRPKGVIEGSCSSTLFVTPLYPARDPWPPFPAGSGPLRALLGFSQGSPEPRGAPKDPPWTPQGPPRDVPRPPQGTQGPPSELPGSPRTLPGPPQGPPARPKASQASFKSAP